MRIDFQAGISSLFATDCHMDFLIQTISATPNLIVSFLGDLMSIFRGGILKPNDTIKMMSTGKEFIVTEVGIITPKNVNKDELVSGEVG